MPNDLFYGGDAILRLGVMADPTTDPTVWWATEFVSLNVAPQRERRQRPLVGQPRNNALDPVAPIPGFERVGFDLVVDADSRQVPRLLRTALGAPATTGSGPYTHVWQSGAQTPVYVCAQLQSKADGSEIRVYRGLVLSAISLSASGEQTRDFNLQLSFRGISRARVGAFLAGTNNAVPTASPMLRGLFRTDGVAASNTLEASWQWDRQLAEDAFLSSTPNLSGIRPGGGQVSGSAKFRAMGTAFDILEEGDTIVGPDIQLLGTVAGHMLIFLHPKAQLEPGAVPISGPGLVERTWAWSGFQDASNPAAKITAVNDVASYAAA